MERVLDTTSRDRPTLFPGAIPWVIVFVLPWLLTGCPDDSPDLGARPIEAPPGYEPPAAEPAVDEAAVPQMDPDELARLRAVGRESMEGSGEAPAVPVDDDAFDAEHELLGRWRVVDITGPMAGLVREHAGTGYVHFTRTSYTLDVAGTHRSVRYVFDSVETARIVARLTEVDGRIVLEFDGRDRLRLTDETGHATMILER